MEMPVVEEPIDGDILEHSDALSQTSSHFAQLKVHPSSEGSAKSFTGKAASIKSRDMFDGDESKSNREDGSVHAHESNIPYISQAKLPESGFELRSVEEFVNSARSSRTPTQSLLNSNTLGYSVSNETFNMPTKSTLEASDPQEEKVEFMKEALPIEMQTIVSEMDSAVDRLRKLYFAEREKSNHFMQQAASSKRLKSQLEEMKTYIKKCDVEMGHLGKAIMQRDQKLREMEIVVHSSENEKASREHAMNEEIRALQMTIKELEHATYDAQKRAELTRTLMEDIQHESERQKEESKASVSALKHAAQEQVLSKVRSKVRKMAAKLEETNRELDQSKSESKEALREAQRCGDELKKVRDNFKVVEAVMKEEKAKRTTVEDSLKAKEQLCGKYEDKIETLKAALEEMNSRLERECASHKQICQVRDLAHREIDRLRTEAQSYKGEIAKLKEAYESSQMRVSRAEGATESVKEEMKNAVSEKKKRIESLQDLLAKNDNTITQMNKRIQWAEEVMEKMKTELVNSRRDAEEKSQIHLSKIQDLQRDLSQYQLHTEKVENQLSDEKEAARTEREKVKELEATLSTLKNSFKAHVHTLENQLSDAKQEAEQRITSLVNENSRLQSRHQEDAEALRSLKDLYRTEQETASLKSEELAQYKRKAEENAAMAQEYEEELKMERSRLKQTENLLSAVREEVHKQSEERLEKYMSAHEAERKDLARKLQEAKGQNAHLVNELDDSRDREANAKNTLRQMWSEMTTTRREMDDMRSRFAAAETAMKAFVASAPGKPGMQSSLMPEDHKFLRLSTMNKESELSSAPALSSPRFKEALNGA